MMVRKTYGSKKDTASGLDHRDMLSTVDDRGSVFDAYYIQNIKQTKRELSSIGSSHHHGVASSRVRKKKYVKRLKDVKEVEVPLRESLSKSVFLTPDKSIHVNKAPDPFDLLFNSSPKSIHVNKAPDPFDKLLNSSATLTCTKQEAKEDPLDKLLVERVTKSNKANTRKKGRPKKINCRPTSEPNKENSEASNSVPQNVTDIKSHELLIEKEATLSRKVNDSLYEIVKNLPTLSDLNKKDCNESIEKVNIKNRLTKNSPFPSPLSSTPYNKNNPSKLINKYKNSSLLNDSKKKDFIESIKKVDILKNQLTLYLISPQKSPLTSTPFNNKHRSKSIYKYSPIPMGELNNTLNTNVTKNEQVEDLIDQNQSIVFVPKNLKNNSNNKSDPKNSKPLFSSVEMTSLHQNSAEKGETSDINLKISEIEPFLGFTYNNGNSSIVISVSYNKQSKTKSCGSNNGSSVDDYPKQRESSKDSKYLSKDHQEESSPERENHEMYNSEFSLSKVQIKPPNRQDTKEIDISSIDLTETSGPFFGFDDKHNLCDASERKTDSSLSINCSFHEYQDENTPNNTDVLATSKNDEQSVHSSENSESDEYGSQNSQSDNNKSDLDVDNSNNTGKNPENDSTISDEFENSNNDVTSDGNESLYSEENDKESQYDTCNSEQSSFTDDSSILPNEPIVVVEKLTASVFEKYYAKVANSTNNETGDYSQDESKSFNDDNNILPNEPVVAVEKLTASVFEKYYGKEANSTNNETDGNSLDESKSENSFVVSNSSIDEIESIEVSSDEASNDTYASFETQKLDNSNTEYHESKPLDTSSLTEMLTDDNYISDKDNNLEDTSTVSSSNDLEDNDTSTVSSIDYGDRCFITTRRRNFNEVAKKESLTVLAESLASGNSSDCDKTVISNHCNISQGRTVSNQDVSENALNTDDDLDEYDKVATPDSKQQQHINTVTEPRISFVTTRNSAKLSRVPEKDVDCKPAIVLQPGKKWERSLSIYRRMTMANDNNDQSILDDEEMHSKGRKYRQSVISMMEMQPECKGTPHNDSTQSRRNTIVCKSSRSTIRIVKDTSSSRVSVCSDLDELQSFLEDCDDTIVELSKLSLEEHDVTVVEKFNEQSRVIASAREYVLRRCNQTDPRPFDECYPDTVLKNCRKIGEGVYGEVYLWRAPDGRARVMKVVPIAGSIRVNGECQKHFHEIISEIVIAMELSALRAPIAQIECHFDEGKEADQLDLHAVENATDVFNEVLAVRCVFGNYPSRLLDLWDLYDECKGSENDNPGVLPGDQQYIVLELANAGQDLESYQFNSAEQAHALLLQVAFGLAVGEEAFQFEHRDLHWGNVLIAPTDQKYATFVLRGRSHRVQRRGVAATIIDYSLSRVALSVGGEPCALYNDLAADEGLFGAVGDHQFEVYRLMRDKLTNEWKSFEPYTNVLWLHYLVDKMITSVRYKRTNTKLHKQYIAKLKAIKHRLLNYGSAVQFVLTDSQF